MSINTSTLIFVDANQAQIVRRDAGAREHNSRHSVEFGHNNMSALLEALRPIFSSKTEDNLPAPVALLLLSEDEFPSWPQINKADLLAPLSGNLLIARLRPNLRAAFSAQANGALSASASGKTVCSLTVGDTMTDVAICHGGEIIDTASMTIGHDCMRFTEDLTITEISETGETFLDAVAKKIKAADLVDETMVNLISALIGEAIANLICRKKAPQVTQRLLCSDPLKHDYEIDEIILSGSILEYVQNNQTDPRTLGHLGGYLANNIVASFQERQRQLELRQCHQLETIVLGVHSEELQLQQLPTNQPAISYALEDCPVIPFPRHRPPGDGRKFLANRIEERLRRYYVLPGAPIVVSLTLPLSEDDGKISSASAAYVAEQLAIVREAIDQIFFLKKPLDFIVLLKVEASSLEESELAGQLLANEIRARAIAVRALLVRSPITFGTADYISWVKPATEDIEHSASIQQLETAVII